MTKGKCMTCGIDISFNAIGYCHNCAMAYYEQREKDLPFVVILGNGDNEEFATEKEAEIFCEQMRSAYIERR